MIGAALGAQTRINHSSNIPYDAAYAAYLDRARWPVGFVWPYCGQIALHVDASYI